MATGCAGGADDNHASTLAAVLVGGHGGGLVWLSKVGVVTLFEEFKDSKEESRDVRMVRGQG